MLLDNPLYPQEMDVIELQFQIMLRLNKLSNQFIGVMEMAMVVKSLMPLVILQSTTMEQPLIMP
jgi:hypothetical protein